MKTPKLTRVQALELQVAQLTSNVQVLMNALEFCMTHIQQRIPSPIVGGEPKTVSMMDYYRAKTEAAKAEAAANSVN